MKVSEKIRSCELIGKGSFGSVFRVEMQDGTIKAVKKLVIPSDVDFAGSLRELDLNRKLSHPNILMVEQICETDKSETKNTKIECFSGYRCDILCLEFTVAIGNLHELVEKHSSGKYLSLLYIKKIFTQILLGLWYMHRNGYIHRDIKPPNILYFENEVIKICDFGLGKRYLKYDRHTKEIASPFFKAPEILLGESYDTSSDIWNAGCVFHYLLSRGDYIVDGVDDLDIDLRYPEKVTKEEEFTAIMNAMPYKINREMIKSQSPMANKFNYKAPRTLTEENFFQSYSYVKIPTEAEVISLSVMLFRNILRVDPKERKSARVLLRTNFLILSPEIKEIVEYEIERYAKNTKEEVQDNIALPIISTQTRTYMTEIATDLFVNHRKTNWYSDRRLFSAMELFDRTTTGAGKIAPLLLPNSTLDKTKFYFNSCLYIAIKFHSAPSEDIGFRYKDTPFGSGGLTNLKNAGLIENKILCAIDYNIYSRTILDEFLEVGVPEMLDLVSLFLFNKTGLGYDLDGNVLNPRESYKKWKSNGSKYEELTKKSELWKIAKNEKWIR